MEIRYTTGFNINGYVSRYQPVYLSQLYNWHFTTGLGRDTAKRVIKLSSTRPTLTVF